MANISSGLIGLSVLSGSNAIASLGTIKTETAAVQRAKALFTTPSTTALWDMALSSSLPLSVQAGMVRGMDSIIDKANLDEAGGSNDVETSFITYKALDRLRILAQAASSKDMSDTERASLQKTFAKGLAELQDYLSGAPGQLVNIAFGNASSSVTGAQIAGTQDISKVTSKGTVSDKPKDPNFSASSVKGNEVLVLDIAHGTTKDRLRVDLRTVAQPQTPEAIADAINAAIAGARDSATSNVAIDADGVVATDDLANEAVLKLKLGSDQIELDMSTLPQPPSNDAIADALNQKLAAMTDEDGQPRHGASFSVDPDSGALLLDDAGETAKLTATTSTPRYSAQYSATANGDGTFALTLDANGDTVTLDQGTTPGYTLPIPGVKGNEVLVVELSRGANSKSEIRLDLSTLQQPPTLQSVANALNDQVKALGSMKDANGNVMLDSKGNPVPLFSTTFKTEKGANGAYGLSVDAGAAYVSMRQENSGDALVVVGSQTQYDVPGGAKVSRVTDALDALTRKLLGSVVATDRGASKTAAEKEKIRVANAEDSKEATTDTNTTSVAAKLTALGSVTDADGNTYIVGTTPGDLGNQRADGSDELFVAKVDSEGNVVWQQLLGAAGESQGAAISLTEDGGVVVAGSVTGEFNGTTGSTGSDMVVARFDATGTRTFATAIQSPGEDYATAVAVAPDGSIYLGGRADVTGASKAYLAHLDASGKMIQQTSIDTLDADGKTTKSSDSITALAFDGEGNLLALTREDGSNAKLRQINANNLTETLSTVGLGAADARAIAVSEDGTIAIAGSTKAALGIGTEANGFSGNRDGFVLQLDADLGNGRTTYLGSTRTEEKDIDGDGVKETVTSEADDQIDSITFMNGQIYVGGRTNGDLSGTHKGTVDGFVSQIDASGAIVKTTQFGSLGATSDAVLVTTSKGGDNIMGALGLRNGDLNAEISNTLASQLGLDENDKITYPNGTTEVLANGDSFSLQLDGGRVQKITIDPGETISSLTLKVQQITGVAARLTTGFSADGQRTIGFSVSEGHTLGIIAGPDGSDALAKMGIEPTRLHSALPRASGAPSVTPGGDFSLSLSLDLKITSRKDAKAAFSALESAISMTQSAYRSLYWDDGKAMLVNGAVGSGSKYQKAQLANYQAALTRLNSGGSTMSLALI